MRGIQVIEWRDETGTEIVHRYPEEGPGTVSLGAQLTVRESQAAVFFRDGQALDVFGPGRHTLTALNLPLVQDVINIPFEGNTPFQAEIYFVNMRTFTNMKWGTPEPILFKDSEFAMIRLRAFGLYTMRIANPQLFVNSVVGTEHRYSTDQVSDWLRDFIVGRFNDTLGEQIDTILKLPQVYDELGIAVRSRLQSDFDRRADRNGGGRGREPVPSLPDRQGHSRHAVGRRRSGRPCSSRRRAGSRSGHGGGDGFRPRRCHSRRPRRSGGTAGSPDRGAAVPQLPCPGAAWSQVLP